MLLVCVVLLVLVELVAVAHSTGELLQQWQKLKKKNCQLPAIPN